MIRSVIFSILLLLPIEALAQDAKPCRQNLGQNRPSIGLALEGGVALGLAHVGVIEWLEENHIPVDCVAGTSMGGLIGSLYSMGYTPSPKERTASEKDMVKFLGDLDWNGIFYDQVDYQNLTFMRKEDRREYPTSLEFRLNRGIKLPEGVNPGHRVGLIFDKLSWPYSRLPRLDDMGIPFRCTATDIIKVQSDVFGQTIYTKDVGKNGSLSEALRATMSVPVFFSPVHGFPTAEIDEKEERIYVDGGVLQNLPVKVLKDMGADIIIAVHLEKPAITPGSDLSLVDIFSNSLSVITSANEKESLKLLRPEDFRITVNVSGFQSTDFARWEELRALGKAAAANENEKNNVLKHQLSQWQIYKDARDARRQRQAPDKVYPQYVTISARRLERKDDAGAGGKSKESAMRMKADPKFEDLIRRSLYCKVTGEGPGGRLRYECLKYIPSPQKDETGCAGKPTKPPQTTPMTGLLVKSFAGTASPSEGSVAESLHPFGDCHADHLAQQLDRLVGTGRFAEIGYHMRSDENGDYVEIQANRKDSSPVLLKPVVEVNASDYTSPIFALGIRFTAFDVGPAGSEWRGEALLGSRYGLKTEYYQPVFGATSKWFVAPRAVAESAPFNIYQQGDQLAHYQLRSISGALDVGYNFSRTAQLRAGYEGGGVKLSRLLGDDIFPFTADRVGTTSLKFSLDLLKFSLYKLEAPVVPRSGIALHSTLQWHDAWLGATSHFPSATMDVAGFLPVNKRGSAYLKADGGSTLGYANDGLPVFSLGGAHSLAAYGSNELLTNQYAHGAAGYIHKIHQFELLGGAIYATGYVEVAKVYGLPGAPVLPKDGTAGIILDSIVGPLFVGGSIGDSHHGKFFFYMGKLF